MRLSPKTLIAGAVAAAVLAVVPAAGATTYSTGGSTGMQILASALAQAYTKSPENKDHVRFTVAGGGSGAGIKGAAAGTFVIGDSSRAPVFTKQPMLVERASSVTSATISKPLSSCSRRNFKRHLQRFTAERYNRKVCGRILR